MSNVKLVLNHDTDFTLEVEDKYIECNDIHLLIKCPIEPINRYLVDNITVSINEKTKYELLFDKLDLSNGLDFDFKIDFTSSVIPISEISEDAVSKYKIEFNIFWRIIIIGLIPIIFYLLYHLSN